MKTHKEKFVVGFGKRLSNNFLSFKFWVGAAIFLFSTYHLNSALDSMQDVVRENVLGDLDADKASVLTAYLQSSKDIMVSYFQLIGSAGVGLAGIREMFKAVKVQNNNYDDDIPV